MKRVVLVLVLGLASVIQLRASATNLGYSPAYVGIGNGCIAGGTCYYIDFTGGNDANNGTSKVTAWKRAPGMEGVTGNAASHVMAQTDEFILKGGEVWPLTSAGGGWTISSGGAASPNGYAYPGVYIGYDPTWNDGTVLSIRVIDPGYCSSTATLSISLTGGGGTAAAATATMQKPDTSFNESPIGTYNPSFSILQSVAITAGGSGYTSNPTVSFSVTAGSCTTLPISYADIYSPIISGAGATWGTAAGDYPPFFASFSIQRVTIDHLEFAHMHLYSSADYAGGNAQMLFAAAANVTWQNLYVHDFTLASISGFNTAINPVGPVCSGALCELDQASTAAIEGDGRQTVNNCIFTNYEAVLLGCASNNGYTASSCAQMTAIHNQLNVTNNVINYWRAFIYTTGCNNACLVAGNSAWAVLKDVGTQHEDDFYLGSGGLTYNNFIRNTYRGAAVLYIETNDGAVPVAKGLPMYVFNNVVWDAGASTPPIGWTSEFTNASTTSFSPSIDMRAWNNTFYGIAGTADCINAGQWFGNAPALTASFTFTLYNNHCISTQADVHWYDSNGGNYGVWNGNTNPNGAAAQSAIDPTAVIQTPTTATSQGYVVGNSYAPTISSSATVLFANGGNSQNLTSLCSSSLNGLSLSNLCYDILGNARPSSTGWQAGAYQYNGASSGGGRLRLR